MMVRIMSRRGSGAKTYKIDDGKCSRDTSIGITMQFCNNSKKGQSQVHALQAVDDECLP